jgi:hypothetical protein
MFADPSFYNRSHTWIFDAVFTHTEEITVVLSSGGNVDLLRSTSTSCLPVGTRRYYIPR